MRIVNIVDVIHIQNVSLEMVQAVVIVHVVADVTLEEEENVPDVLSYEIIEPEAFSSSVQLIYLGFRLVESGIAYHVVQVDA